MFLFFVTCFSFILFYRYSLPIKPLPPWACEMRLLSFYFWKDLSILFPSAKSLKKNLSINFNSNILSAKSSRKSKAMSSPITTTENFETTLTERVPNQMSVLDLPELALESILERLEPDGLCRMACVCTYLRDMCLSDHLWEGHMKQRWGRIIGSAAHREWQSHIAKKESNIYFLDGGEGRGFFMGYLSKLLPVILVRSSFNSHHSYGSNDETKKMKISSQTPDSIVSCYRALETGNFWFPAQVFNRENGHVGFMLSCYDAEVSYDPRTDSFQARYPPHGRRAVAIESGVAWDRLRAPPVDTSPDDLYISDCLNDLRPRDHIEIQWRRNKQFPYGWWYGVVGHLETCDGNDAYCLCHESDTVVLEFNQYAPGSRWRHTMINRKDHHEEGNEIDGFYGGIRKLQRNDEISSWQQFWPAEILE